MITSSDYILLADAFADVHDSGVSCVDEITAVISSLNDTNVAADRAASFLAPILQAQNTLASEQEQPSVNILKAVRNLQVAVTQAESLSAFLSSNGITVKQGFADLSALVGFVIPNAYISAS